MPPTANIDAIITSPTDEATSQALGLEDYNRGRPLTAVAMA